MKLHHKYCQGSMAMNEEEERKERSSTTAGVPGEKEAARTCQATEGS